MPQMSTHLHFAKLLKENADDDVHLCSFLMGIAAPDTYPDEEAYDDFHFIEDDGNEDDDIDVREFYEKFDFKKMDIREKWFIIGYYAHLWLDEYIKFNTSKLTLNNDQDLPDQELTHAVVETMRLFDYEVTEGYFDEVIKEIDRSDFKISSKLLSHVDLDKAKQLIKETYYSQKPTINYGQLLDKDEYVNLINKSVNRFFKSL
ncbi:MAG: hypothetical protein JXQ26_00085 [Tissierellales bacterium]|nr:hypothetical protein [Tissierellales bacterium]MBN2826354.1 hypothetical protein [Tissierellales bacterium]